MLLLYTSPRVQNAHSSEVTLLSTTQVQKNEVIIMRVLIATLTGVCCEIVFLFLFSHLFSQNWEILNTQNLEVPVNN